MIFITCAVVPPWDAFLDHILIYDNIFPWLLRTAWYRNTQCHSNDNCWSTTIPTESQLNFNFFQWGKPGGANYHCFNTVQFYLRHHLCSKQKHFRSCWQTSSRYVAPAPRSSTVSREGCTKCTKCWSYYQINTRYILKIINKKKHIQNIMLFPLCFTNYVPKHCTEFSLLQLIKGWSQCDSLHLGPNSLMWKRCWLFSTPGLGKCQYTVNDARTTATPTSLRDHVLHMHLLKPQNYQEAFSAVYWLAQLPAISRV